MSYRNNQFYFPVPAGEEYVLWGGPAGTVPIPNNPPFAYPDPTVRINDHDGVQSKKLQRGYIRSLLTEAQGTQVPIKKCRFQFNPARLAQSVQMNSSMLNFFQQDPAQLAQPLGSEVSFAFEVMFDRSMEMNNPDVKRTSPDPTAPWATGDPADVGVLRDIATFYSVIGQGISEDQAAFATAQYSNTLTAEFNAAEGSISDSDLAQAQQSLSEFTSDIDVNVGNTAFLMPLPVRVLFSSLYMVEGYVTSTEVVYTKFSTTMVPMQAYMSVTMRALYIGFAKQNTFVTENIKQSIEAEKSAAKQESEDKTDAYKALLDELSVLKYWLTDSSLLPGSVGWALTSKSQKSQLMALLPNATSDGDMVKMFNSSTPVSVEYSLNLKVFGPFNKASEVNQRTGTIGSQVPLLSLPLASRKFTSAEDWKKYAVARGTYGSSSSRTVGTAAAPSNGTAQTLDSSKYYSWTVDGSAKVTIGGQPITGTIPKQVYVGTESEGLFWYTNIDFELPIRWDVALSSPDSLPPINDVLYGTQDGVSEVD